MKKYLSISMFLSVLFFIPFLSVYTVGLLASFVAWDISLFTAIFFAGGLNRLMLLFGLIFVGTGIAAIKADEVSFK